MARKHSTFRRHSLFAQYWQSSPALSTSFRCVNGPCTLGSIEGNPKMTQRELAEKTGIRPGTVGAMYHGRIKRVELDQIDRLCEVLGCGPGELFERG